MEIPIQVAVRINPWINSINKYPVRSEQQKQQKQKNQCQFDDNGNENTDNNDVDGDDDDEKNQLNEETEQDQVCVQAFPIAAGGGVGGGGVKLNNGITAGLIQVGQHSFPVTHALPSGCQQNQVYHQAVFPLIALLLEGFDASVVTYGQKGAGKTYALYGLGFDCAASEADQGIVQRSVREIFAFIAKHPERTYALYIGFVEICGDVIRDLLGVGNVPCKSLTEVFHWLQLGLSARTKANANNNDNDVLAHTLFTLTLEQQWLSKEGLIQHRLSTASFSDLCSTDRLFMLNQIEKPFGLPKDLGLQALEHVVNTITDPKLMYNMNGNHIPYTQTTLTTLLKDSFGGRAQTLIIMCISPFRSHVNETLCNLQFAFKAQCIRNFVIMNTFSDDNTLPMPAEMMANTRCSNGLPNGNDNFGLQFAASQWFKLVSNAEGLFSKLINSNALSAADKEQIEEWMFLKQECEECLSSNEALKSQKHLVPIQETDEPDNEDDSDESLEDDDDDDDDDMEDQASHSDTDPIINDSNSLPQNSDNDSDSESPSRPDFNDKLDNLMETMKSKTDALIVQQHEEFLAKQPKPVMESQESFKHLNRSLKPNDQTAIAEREKADERRVSLSSGRRRSIQPGSTLSSVELAMLNRLAAPKEVPKSQTKELQLQTAKSGLSPKTNHTNLDNIIRKLRKLDTDIEGRERQIKELQQTIHLKQNIIAELIRNSETRSNAKQRFNKKKSKLEAEYEKTKKQLNKAINQGKEKADVERLQNSLAHLQQKLQDLISMKQIAGESGQKIKTLQESVEESKHLLEELQRKMKKERRIREELNEELKLMRKEKANTQALVKQGFEYDSDLDNGDNEDNEMDQEMTLYHGKQLKEVQSRISHLDHVLKEKSSNLERCKEVAGAANADDDASSENRESLRHEIRNLRRTRDHLLEQRCSLDQKLKRDKMLTHKDERKLLECDEAIEAIDAAIEFKNELICGHKSIDTSESLQREKGEQMLMARLNKLSSEEMRTLLYKYFIKVIDLRTSSLKLENQLMQLEREKDSWEWKERVLSNAVRQARLEGERNAVLLQRQHEMKLTLMLRHFAEETSASSSLASDATNTAATYANHYHNSRYARPITLAIQQEQHHRAYQARHAPHYTNIPTTPTASDSEYDLDYYKQTTATATTTMATTTTAATAKATASATTTTTSKYIKNQKMPSNEICPVALPNAVTKYKPLDKLKEKERERERERERDRETKNKLFAKFQVLTRYASHQNEADPLIPSLVHSKKKDKHYMSKDREKEKEKERDNERAVAAIPQENLKILKSSPSATKVTRQKNKIIIQNASRK